MSTLHLGVKLRATLAVGEIVDRMQPLVDFLKTNRHVCATITLARRDWDLIVHWPATAAAYGFQVTKGVVTWNGFSLRADNSVPRYKADRAEWENG